MAVGLKSAFPKDAIKEEILQCDAGFTFIDFLPRVIGRSGKNIRTDENFQALVDRANEFLQSNSKWSIVTCESVQFISKGNKDDSVKILYPKDGHSYVRGLRLWLTEKKNEKERKQQIGYLNLLPELLDKNETLKLLSPYQMGLPKLELLDKVIERFNSNIQSSPLPGGIISIQSERMMIEDPSSYPNFDADSSLWTYCESERVYVIILRIFYDIMTASSEEIGIKDFLTDVDYYTGELYFYDKYGTISDESYNDAAAWCAQQQNFRFCNVQTVDINMLSPFFMGGGKRMDYIDTKSTLSVRILRVAYTKPCSVEENSSLLRNLTIATFTPVRLAKRHSENRRENISFESFVDTRKRISAWVKETGARVLSAETNIYPSITERNDKGQVYKLFVLRLYLEGDYGESLSGIPQFVSEYIPEDISEN